MDRKIGKACRTDFITEIHVQTTIIFSWVHGLMMDSWIHGSWIRVTAYSYVVALIHDLKASSNIIYQIANRDHRSAPETCRLLNQASSMWNLECAQDLRGDFASLLR